MPTERTSFLGIDFDALSISAVLDRLASVNDRQPFSYLVTPNVDHIVLLDGDPELKSLYSRARICVCDSRILKRLARLSGLKLPLVPGSDLTRLLFQTVLRAGDRICVVGGSERLLTALRNKFPGIDFVHHVAPMGLRSDATARRAAAQFIANSQSRFTLLSVGAPQQEMIASETVGMAGATGMGLCVGASLEFLTGHQQRAPRLLQIMGVEWLYRLISNPRRLWRRYLVDDVKVFPLFVRSVRRQTWALAIGLICVIGGSIAIAAYGYLSVGSSGLNSSTIGPHKSFTPKSVGIVLPGTDKIRPLSADEAASANAERPFVARPDAPASAFRVNPAEPKTAAALTCLTQAIYYEAASEGVDGGRAVAQVILNRVRHPGFPNTVCGVVYEGSERETGCQFSFTCDGSLLRPEEPRVLMRSRKIAEKALAGDVFAEVGHSTHYHANYVLPYWADSLDKTVLVGRHIFYRLPGALGDIRLFSQRYGGAEFIPAFRMLNALAIPSAADALGLSGAIAQEVAGEKAPALEAIISEKPLADTSKGALIADELTTLAGLKGVAHPACSTGLENTQMKPLQSEQFQLRSKITSRAC